jgi:hypothetical protein
VEFPQNNYQQSEQRIAVMNQRASGRSDAVIGAQFFRELNRDLTEAMGPMASIVLQDSVKRLGQTVENFPAKKLQGLIESVSNEILDPSVRQRFCKTAFDRFRMLGAE